MNFLRIATSSGLFAVALAPFLGIAHAADRSETFVQLAQANNPPKTDEDDKGRKGKGGDRGGEPRGGEGRGGEGRGGERRGGEGRGDDARGGEGRGGDRGDRGNRPDQPPAKQAAPPEPPQQQQRQVTPPSVQPRQTVPLAFPRQEQKQFQPLETPRVEKPNKQQEFQRVEQPQDRDDDRRKSDRRDNRPNGFNPNPNIPGPTNRRDFDRRDDRRPQVEDRRDDRDNRRPQVEDRRDDRDNRRPQVDDRRGPPPVQAEPRRLDTFKDRFRSRVGEDKAFQDLRRGRDERVRERRERTRQASPFRGFEDLKSKRRERREGGAIVIEEPDKRSIIREGGRSIIRTDENERLRRNFRDVRREKRNGRDVTIAIGAGGVQIFTDFDDDGRPRRRWRRGADGRDVVLFDNSRSRGWGRHRRGGLFDAIIDLPPPRLRIPRDEYIVDYDRASEDDLYDALSAPPVDEIDEGYSIDEIRSSYSLRDRMRRIDLDTINFAFGSWEVEEQDYDRLERVARAMRRVLRRNADEMFLIEGHTDAVGSDEDNLTLSDRRAESVARILSEEFQIPAENLTTQGYGEQFLKIDTSEPERVNRRVAIRRITPLLAR